MSNTPSVLGGFVASGPKMMGFPRGFPSEPRQKGISNPKHPQPPWVSMLRPFQAMHPPDSIPLQMVAGSVLDPPPEAAAGALKADQVRGVVDNILHHFNPKPVFVETLLDKQQETSWTL